MAWRRQEVGRDGPSGEVEGGAAWASARKDCGPFPGSYHSAEGGELKKHLKRTYSQYVEQETSTGRSTVTCNSSTPCPESVSVKL